MLDQLMTGASRPADDRKRRAIDPLRPWNLLAVGCLFAGLYAVGRHNFLLFHTLAEVFAIIVACALAMLAWNSRRYMDNNYVLFIAIALGCAAAVDLLHALSYKGMNIFPNITANRPTQLWIAGRYLQSISFVIAPITIGRSVNFKAVIVNYLLVTVLACTAIIHWKIFPDCFIEGEGLTRFKIASEYLICLLFCLGIYLLYRKRHAFDHDVLRLLIFSLVAAIIAEIAFTFYISVYGLSNMVGHIFKIICFYVIYKAVVQTGLIRHHRLMFLNLEKKQASLVRVRDELETRVVERTAELVDVNEHLRRTNRALRALTDCHQALIRGHDEKRLVDDICRVVVETGGYCFAWAAFVDPHDTNRVLPIAHQGYEEGYLDAIRDAGGGGPDRHGVPGEAVAFGKVVVNNDLFSQADRSRGRYASVHRGYGASISLPLMIRHRVMGELNIYSAIPNAFDNQEENLLTELANELSYGIEALRSRSEREWALKERDKLLFLIEQSTDLVSIISLEGEVLYLNQAGRVMLEIDQVEGISAALTLHKMLRSGLDILDKNILPGLMASGHWQGELELHQIQTGRPIISDVNVFTIREPNNGHPVAYATVCRDIRQRKKMESHLRQSQKMESIGVLAGGIAHDFNNILAAISGFAELVLSDLAEGSQQHSNIREVIRASSRARELVKQILTFSRHGKQEHLPTQIGLCVKEALKLLRASLPANIEIRQDIQSRALVSSDPTQIHQVVMNLCTNAGHAMQESGGCLEVRLVDASIEDASLIRRTGLPSGVYVNLTVRDSGCGMSADQMERIFDPFFTTKSDGEGTGMGLAVVHGIVNSHGGAITVDSRPDCGATFDIYWPLAELEERVQIPADTEIPTGCETILFVDDEIILTIMGRQLLASLGYQVVTHTSSVAALHAFKAAPDQFDAMITDMTMPGMGGDELAEEIVAIRPDFPIIMYTGYSNRIDAQKARSIGIRSLLPKPIRKAEMAMAIRNALDNRPLSDILMPGVARFAGRSPQTPSQLEKVIKSRHNGSITIISD